MTKYNGEGGRAYPKSLHGQDGMSLRDYFAGQALVAIPHIGCGDDLEPWQIAIEAYNMADAMIAARGAK